MTILTCHRVNNPCFPSHMADRVKTHGRRGMGGTRGVRGEKWTMSGSGSNKICVHLKSNIIYICVYIYSILIDVWIYPYTCRYGPLCFGGS